MQRVSGFYKNEKNRKVADYKCSICGDIFTRRVDAVSIEQCIKCSRKIASKKSSVTKLKKNKLKPKIKCCVEGCDRDAMYKKDKLCQKHYFRNMRFGTFDLTSTRKYKIKTPNGYIKVFEPNCFLSDKSGYVFEHRFIFLLSGKSVESCNFCMKNLTWKSVHIDHIDNNRENNDLSNLRPLCNGCNTKRPAREKIKELSCN